MKFERVSDWAQVSDCGKYTVSAAKVAEMDGRRVKLLRFKFQAWHVRPDGQPALLLGTFDDAESARKLCREHAEPLERTA